MVEISSDEDEYQLELHLLDGHIQYWIGLNDQANEGILVYILEIVPFLCESQEPGYGLRVILQQVTPTGIQQEMSLEEVLLGTVPLNTTVKCGGQIIVQKEEAMQFATIILKNIIMLHVCQ